MVEQLTAMQEIIAWSTVAIFSIGMVLIWSYFKYRLDTLQKKTDAIMKKIIDIKLR